MARWPPTPEQPARGTASTRNLSTAPQSARRSKHTSDRRTSRLESPDRHQRPQRCHMVGHNHHRPPRTSPRHQTLGQGTPQTSNPHETVTRHAHRQPRVGDSLPDTGSRRGRWCQPRMARLQRVRTAQRPRQHEQRPWYPQRRRTHRNDQQPHRTSHTRRLRIAPLRALPHQSAPLRRQTQLDPPASVPLR